MARPCCKARKEFPELHSALLASTEGNLQWFRYISTQVIGTVRVKDADTIAGIAYRHDPDNRHGLGYIAGFLADFLTGMKARGLDMPTSEEDFAEITRLEDAARDKLRERLNREPTAGEIVAAVAGDIPLPR